MSRTGLWLLLLACAASAAQAQQVLWSLDPPHPAGQHSGFARVGDLDRDGFDDLVMDVYPPLSPGSPLPTVPNLWFFSGRDGRVLRQGMRLPSTGTQTFFALVTAGDMDHDGLDDYAVTYILQTSVSPPIWVLVVEVRSAASDTVIWSRSKPDGGFGYFLAGDLDLNGDGKNDLVVSSILVRGTPGVTGNGLVEAYDHQGNLLHTVIPAPNELIGAIVAPFVDYDGDGCDDYLSGVSEFSLRGAVDIISGRTGQVLRRVWGHPGDLVGNSLSRAGDLDGDGIADIVAGHTDPTTQGVLNAIGSVSGRILYRWAAPSIFVREFGRYVVADVDVDRDGVTDVLAGSYWFNPFNPSAVEGPFYVFSGRDGSSLLEFFDPAGITPNGLAYSRVVAMPRPPGDPFPRFMVWDTGFNLRGRGYVFSGAPAGVSMAGTSCAGTLQDWPRIGLRDYGPSGFRVHLSNAESTAGSFLVLGLAPGAPPFVDPSASLRLAGCTLLPIPHQIGFFVTGASGIDRGYAFHHFARPLAPTPVPGGLSFFAQWIALGNGPTWPGGLTEALRIQVR